MTIMLIPFLEMLKAFLLKTEELLCWFVSEVHLNLYYL